MNLPTFFILIVVPVLCGCSKPQTAEIDVTARIEDGKLVFDVDTIGINGLLGISVSGGDEILWDVDMFNEKGGQITYGALPANGTMDATQIIPTADSPPPPINGRQVTVAIVYQYDNGFAACAACFRKSILIPEAEQDITPDR